MSTITVSDVVAGISDACDLERVEAQELLDAIIEGDLAWLDNVNPSGDGR
jgi:hypothetical protein